MGSPARPRPLSTTGRKIFFPMFTASQIEVWATPHFCDPAATSIISQLFIHTSVQVMAYIKLIV
jgi:hypothetical protein